MSARPIVIGSGPAGQAAAVWLRSYGLDPLWLAGPAPPGGTLHRVYNPLRNVPGTDYSSGRALAGAIAAQIERSSLRPLWRSATSIARAKDESLRVRDGAGQRHDAPAVIIATGTRNRALSVPGAQELAAPSGRRPRLLFDSASAHGELVRGKSVGVIGGGDAAFENALILAALDCEVILLARSAPRARRSFVERALGDERIAIAPIPSTTASLERTDADRVRVTLDAPDRAPLELDALFVRIGVDPVLPPLLELSPRLDSEGALVVDELQRTDVAGLLAAGDVTHRELRSVVSAAAAGARAALTAARLCGAFDPIAQS